MKTLQELIEEFKELPDCEEYTSWQGKKCYRICGDVAFYFLKCNELGIDSKWTGDNTHEAKGEGYSFNYCEHDITIALDNTGKQEIAKLYKQGETLTEELRAVQEQIKALKGNPTIKYADFCALKKREFEIKVAFCELNIKLAEVANKYEEYCEFFEEEIK